MAKAFLDEDFLLSCEPASPAVPRVRAGDADLRLPLPPAGGRGRRQPPLREPEPDLADRGPLQVAGHAGPGGRGAADHRRRARLREVRGLGGHRALHRAQPHLPLDAHGAQGSVRDHRPAPRAGHRPGDLRGLHRPPAERGFPRPRPDAPLPGAGGLHHRRPGRRPGAAPADRRRGGPALPGVPRLPPRQGHGGGEAGGLEPLGGPAGGGGGPVRSATTAASSRPCAAGTPSSTPPAAGFPTTASRSPTPPTSPSGRRPPPSPGCGPARPWSRTRWRRSRARCSTSWPSWTGSAGWTQQFHFGALRNTNTRAMGRIGPDSGYDAIGDFALGRPLVRLLDRLDSRDRLARTVLYSLNPQDNELLASIAGCFQDGIVPGKVQLGAAWWFNDQKDGMAAPARGRLGHRPAFPLRGHAHRLAELPLLPAPRVLPPPAVQPAGPRRGGRRAARRLPRCWAGSCRTSATATRRATSACRCRPARKGRRGAEAGGPGAGRSR